jgi:hypothetical protein
MSPYDLGKNLVVEDCQRLSVYDYLKSIKVRSKEVLLGLTAEILGLKINFTTTPTQFNGSRLWFNCPHCDHRIKYLLIHPFTLRAGCRGCLGLIYGKQRFKGMLESNLLQFN